jgi:hypothetical protein
MSESAVLDRTPIVRRGRRLEYFTIAWNTLEGLVAVVAGAIAGSISLVGFGIDSFIEVTSGSVLLCQMIDDLKEQEGVHGICGLGTCRDRAASIGFTTT